MMNRKNIAVIAALLCLSWIAGHLIFGSDTARPTPTNGGVTLIGDDAEPDAAASEPYVRLDESTPRDQPDPTVRAALEIRMRDDDTVVAGAVVTTFAHLSGAEIDRGAMILDAENFGATRGHRTVTGGDGIATITKPLAGLSHVQRSVVVRHGAHYAQVQVPASIDTTPLVVHLENDLECTVRVVDHDGNPAPDVLVMHSSSRDALSGATNGATRGFTTGPDGEFILRHLQIHTATPGEHGFVWIKEPGFPVERVAITAEHLRDGLTLTLPRTGTLRVTVENLPEFARLGATVSILDGKSGARSTELRSGVALFAWTKIGSTFDITVECRAGRRSLAKVEGPKLPGETVDVVLDFGPAAAIRAAFVDADGVPLPDRVLRIEYEVGGEIVRGGAFTASDGVLWEPVLAWALGARLDEVRFEVLNGPEQGAQLAVACAGATLESVVDLGIVTVSREPVWAAGRFVDDLGEPTEAPRFSTVTIVDATEGASPPTYRRLRGNEFELRGGAGVRTITLMTHAAFSRATHRRQVRPIRMTAGDRNATIELAEAVTFDVAYSSPGGVVAALQWHFIRAAADFEVPLVSPQVSSSDGLVELRFAGVPVGRYRVEARWTDSGTIAAAADHVTVTADRSIGPVPLRVPISAFHVHSLVLLGTGGLPIEDDVQARIRFASGSEIPIVGAAIVFGASRRHLEFALSIDGQRIRHIESVADREQTVDIQQRDVSFAVRLRNAVGSEDHKTYRVRLSRAGFASSNWRAGKLGDRLLLQVAEPGTYSVDVEVVLGPGRTSAVAHRSPDIVEVADLVDREISITIAANQ